nr:alkaline phosphatase family protein [Marinicella sediminis]
MVLGVDGMDHSMTKRLMDEGRMPNFSRLSKQGMFGPLGTSVPPLSPVAWSDFMTGMDSGGHGIYDFLHRDPKTLSPEFSMSKTIPPEDHISIGSWHLPTDSGQLINLRKGPVFWGTLKEHGVFTSIMRMPANYPPVGAGDQELTGMGTPDLHGGYGRFTFINSRFGAGRKQVDGGEIQEVWSENGAIMATLKGPLNPFKDPELNETLELPIRITVTSEGGRIIIDLDDQLIKLSPGEWSDWVPVEFTMMPLVADLHGMVRFYLRQTTPNLELYVSPINFDPLNPDTALSHPHDFVEDLAEEGGRFYTQGMPEDTKAFESGILTQEEFFQQAEITARDSLLQLNDRVKELLENRRSFLFYYLGHLDQVSHMTWKSTDPEHPTYDPETDPVWAAKIEQLYMDIDQLVGQLSQQLGKQATLMVISDHGFAPWRRQMDLNGWLLQHGYLTLKNGNTSSPEGLVSVDWSKTRAYAIGFNGIYINKQGREQHGVVSDEELPQLIQSLRSDLLATKDPDSGRQAITKVYITADYFSDQSANPQAPDLIAGFAYGTRNSSSSALGAVSAVGDVFTDHTDAWSGDHSMDHETVPGIFLTNNPNIQPPFDLKQMASTILTFFDSGASKQ